MPEILLRRTIQGLAAASEDAVDALRRIPQGDVVRVMITRPRNVQYHRWFFAMLHIVYQTCGDWASTEELLTELKFRVGHVDRQRVIDKASGEVIAEIIKPKSIAFHSMDQDEFFDFCNRCISVICNDMVPGLDDHALREEVLRALS